MGESPEYRGWQARYEEWDAAHTKREPTGGTRLGPSHYFRDCDTLLHRGPRGPEARIVALDFETAQALRLPICKECKAKMASFERQIASESELACVQT
jgi:hypothetical protein